MMMRIMCEGSRLIVLERILQGVTHAHRRCNPHTNELVPVPFNLGPPKRE
jgi:hypothetical protein